MIIHDNNTARQEVSLYGSISPKNNERSIYRHLRLHQQGCSLQHIEPVGGWSLQHQQRLVLQQQRDLRQQLLLQPVNGVGCCPNSFIDILSPLKEVRFLDKNVAATPS